ncbi:MAG TPA: MTH938/NDUFAF3 family protein [Steroidobacteraceae bacterium]|nr:MTH938/NDUFAF3 family protein [Steroidobacteraceae bacterium]
MRFTQDASPNVNVIRGYGPGELRINHEVFRTTMIVAPAAIRPAPSITDAALLDAEQAALLLDMRPEVVLIGTGRQQVFPVPSFSVQFLKAGIGFEAMDTGAACRTFNVLVSEQRQVVALLIV